MSPRLVLVEGDITRQMTDAIVNAANESLLAGGGVCGAIHRAAGPGLEAECRSLGGCPTGEARITKGHRLEAPWVIHAVGPVWRGGAQGEDALLALCYRNSLALAHAKGLKSIAFPAISTGIFGFPPERAARIAIREALAWPKPHPERIVFVLFGREAYETFAEAYAEASAQRTD